MLLPFGSGNESFHWPVPNNGISILGIPFAYIRCCCVGQTSDKFSGCQEQPLLTCYAQNWWTCLLSSNKRAWKATHVGLWWFTCTYLEIPPQKKKLKKIKINQKRPPYYSTVLFITWFNVQLCGTRLAKQPLKSNLVYPWTQNTNTSE